MLSNFIQFKESLQRFVKENISFLSETARFEIMPLKLYWIINCRYTFVIRDYVYVRA